MGGRTVVDGVGRRVREDAVLVEIGEAVRLGAECWGQDREEGGVVDGLNVHEVKDLRGMGSGIPFL